MRFRLAIVGGAVAGLVAVAVPAFALLSSSASVPSNTVTTATLAPPTGLSATATCVGGAPAVDLAWTATSSSFADGYDVYRSGTAGGPYDSVGRVTPRTAVSYADEGLQASTTYYYVLQATAHSWTSADSAEVQATTPAGCA